MLNIMQNWVFLCFERAHVPVTFLSQWTIARHEKYWVPFHAIWLVYHQCIKASTEDVSGTDRIFSLQPFDVIPARLFLASDLTYLPLVSHIDSDVIRKPPCNVFIPRGQQVNDTKKWREGGDQDKKAGKVPQRDNRLDKYPRDTGIIWCEHIAKRLVFCLNSQQSTWRFQLNPSHHLGTHYQDNQHGNTMGEAWNIPEGGGC